MTYVYCVIFLEQLLDSTNDAQPTHLQYIIAAANLHAFNYGLRGETDPALFKKVADEVIVPEFTPRSGVKVQINDNDPTPQNDAGDSASSNPRVL